MALQRESKHANLFFLIALIGCAVWPIAKNFSSQLPIELMVFLSGLAIFSAAFILSWTSEAAEVDLPQGVALILVAFIAVLPEYAVDMYFAWVAGKNPSYTAYATANMTGSNRLLIGAGWAAVVLAGWISRRHKSIRLDKNLSVEIVALSIATLYAFIIPLKGNLSWIDSLIFVSIFALYAYRTSMTESGQVELEGPAHLIASLPKTKRQLAVCGLFIFSAAIIAVSAAPFAEGMIDIGKHLGINEFFLIQWLAPFASEAPEFIVAIIFALKGKATVGLRILVSSKVNQWTLLVGMLPMAYHLSAGSLNPMHLDSRQIHEILLTAAQSFFALTLLFDLDFEWKEALMLFILFILQPWLTSALARDVFIAVYVIAGVNNLSTKRKREYVSRTIRHTFSIPKG